MKKIGVVKDALSQALKRFTQKELAQRLEVATKTVSRWEQGQTEPPNYVMHALLNELSSAAIPSPKNSQFTFIDLFAGIGGIRMGFQDNGGKCVFTSEWNEMSRKTYLANFQSEHAIQGDITKIEPSAIPDHDVLLAGFPCQPFSIAGVSKKNSLGRAHGFACEAQGTLFFDIARILAAKRPHAFLLENVKNLTSHDKGRTFKVIEDVLRNQLGYQVHTKVIDARQFVPQHRETILILGFREPRPFSWTDFQYPPSSVAPALKDIFHPGNGLEEAEGHYTTGSKARVDPRYTLSDKLWQYLQNYSAKHKAMGNGFGFGLVKGTDVARTLSARYYKDGSEILVYQGPKRNPRRLTPRECSRLMGFDKPDRKFVIPVSDTQAYKQFGNSVAVPVMRELARIMKPHILTLKAKASTPKPTNASARNVLVAV